MKEATDENAVLVFDMGGSTINWTLAEVSLIQARSVADRLNLSFSKNVQKNSGYFNAPNTPWELHLYSAEGDLLAVLEKGKGAEGDRKSTRLNSSHVRISYAVFCLKKKKTKTTI